MDLEINNLVTHNKCYHWHDLKTLALTVQYIPERQQLQA